MSSTEGSGGDEQTRQIIDELLQMEKDLNATAGQIALAWVMQKGVFPIIGARTVSDFETSLKAADLNLSDSEMLRLDEINAIPIGYPHELLTTVQKKY